MRKNFLLFIVCLFSVLQLAGQETIFYEDFGNNYYSGPMNGYTNFSSAASMFSADSIIIHNYDPQSGYPGASGQGFAICGINGGNVVDLIIISGINTADYSNIRLSYGTATWYGLASNYMNIYYSTDGSLWTLIDDQDLASGQYGDATWGYVTLNASLPAVPNLRLKFNVTDPVQAVRFDDITVTGVGVDNTPPSQPSGLELISKTFNSLAFRWNASNDDIGLGHYDIYRDGIFYTSVEGTSAEVKYLNPGTTMEFTVVAVDLVNNASAPSAPLEVTLDPLPADYKYSWQEAQATVLPEGNLQWNPRPFNFETGSSVRYIDYEDGDDTNNGQSQTSAWKHHPWDPNASGNAAASSGIHTYVFRRGVIYRGSLTAEESGEPGDPIRLTSDPSWGTGEACIYGSVGLTGGWTQADTATAPNIPEPGKVWYRNISLPETKVIVETTGGVTNRIRVARMPNYQYTPDDPLKTWFSWTSKSKSSNLLLLADSKNLTQPEVDRYKGGTVWSQEDVIVMCTVWGQQIQDYNPSQHQITVSDQNFGGVKSHYFIENTPFLLDTVNEFYYDKNAGRLFVRLEDEKDPNTATLEVATTEQLLIINGKHDIAISGLTFGYTTTTAIRYGYADTRSAIRMTGSCRNIVISNNNFRYVNGGISAQNSSSENLTSSDITVSDNDFYVVDDLSIIFGENNGVYFRDVHIMRNRIYDNGARQRGRWYSSIPAILGQFRDGEAAGNIVDVSWGNGLDFFWGKSSGDSRDVPLIRGMIYQNMATNTLLGTNDYGGIESWQGGPAFCFNNVSHNASGYKHYNNSSIGYAYYFDGAFKQIVFNNIASGVSHNRNAASIMQVLGFYNIYAHNTAYNTNVFFDAATGSLQLNGYNAYLGNVGEDVSTFFSHQIDKDYIPFESYGNNISSSLPFSGSLENKGTKMNLDVFRNDLETYKSQDAEVGWNSAMPVTGNASGHDFRLKADGEALDRGVKFFTAFPLAAVVGEWNFLKHPADPSIIMGDNLYMTSEYSNRDTYQDIPKNNLTVHNVSDTSFVMGELEDWTNGALWFDGASVWCSVSDAAVRSHRSNNVDMTDNSFILELFVRPDSGSVNGILVSKQDNGSGYELGIDDSGDPVMSLYSAGGTASQTANMAINDGKGHHVLAEINRAGSIQIYVDGEAVSGISTGTVPGPDESLSNTSDLLVGRNAGGSYFRGSMDFLRISKGLLADAKTTIGELYTWETGGPFLYDIAGNEPVGKRDAGAIEAGSKPCQMNADPLLLSFDETSSTQVVTVDSYQGFSIYGTSGGFFTAEPAVNSLSVTVDENPDARARSGEVLIYGCNESVRILIEQDAAPCIFETGMDTVRFTSEEQSLVFRVYSNDRYTTGKTGTFFSINKVISGDSLKVSVTKNTTVTERTGEILLTGCDGPVPVPVIQEAGANALSSYLPEGMEIYPNPVSSGILHLTLPGINRVYTVTVTDLTGKILINKIIPAGTSAFPVTTGPGTYMLRIRGRDEDVISKLIVL